MISSLNEQGQSCSNPAYQAWFFRDKVVLSDRVHKGETTDTSTTVSAGTSAEDDEIGARTE